MTIATTQKLVAPQINLNGTSFETLKQELVLFLKAIDQALYTGHAVTCHPRDYQFQEPGTWLIAKDQKEQVMTGLMEIREYAIQQLSSIEEQRN